MKLNRYWKLAIVGGLAASLIGCTSSGGGTSGNGTTGDTANASGSDKPVQLAFVTNNASDYWTIARKGVDKAKAELKNVNVDFVIPGTGSAAEQKTLIENELAKGVQGIAVSPKDPANETDFLNDTAKKALVVTQDSDAPKSDRACYIGTDNVAAGKSAGEQVLKALPNGGNIMCFVGDKDAQNAHDRYEGLVEALKGSKVKILDVRTDETDRAKAKTNVSDTLTKYPDVAGLVGLWSYNGPMILSAVKDAGKAGKIKIVCFDEEADTLGGIKDGFIDATIVQQPFVFGEKSIQVMAAYIRGDKSSIPANKQIIVDTKVIDKGTVDAFKADLDKLRK